MYQSHPVPVWRPLLHPHPVPVWRPLLTRVHMRTYALAHVAHVLMWHSRCWPCVCVAAVAHRMHMCARAIWPWQIVLLGDGNEKPFYVEMPDVAMRASLAEVTAAVAAAANVTAKGGGSSGSEHKYKQAQTLEEGANEKRLENAGRHERRLRQTLKEISFPQSKATEHRPFQAVALENMANGDKLPCGLIWQAGGQQADKIAVGSLLHRRGESNAEPPPRHFDASPLGKPTLSEARKLIELTLSLRLQPKPEQGNKSGGASASGAAPSKKQRKA